MIGVCAPQNDRPVVKEFFELFKTPWEFYGRDRRYEVLICSDNHVPENSAKLVLIYGSEENPFDEQNGIKLHSRYSNTALAYKADRIPIYGKCLTFKSGADFLRAEAHQESAAVEIARLAQNVLRIGFDLFYEIRHLLTHGQPGANSRSATLELHITLIRDLVVSHSIPLVEIPPVPSGYNFIACLTHDVDHVAIRNYKCDPTVLGFLYRAIIGSVIDFSRGRRPREHIFANWKAAFSLPFIYLGLTTDFWSQFDRYIEIERGHPSTFFVIPRKNDPGQSIKGRAPSKRAAHYELSEIKGQLQRLLTAGCEVGLHGIDAWKDAAKGRAELQRIKDITGESDVGVRMHWLYFDDKSHAVLDKAGCCYDSTVGYNETVGYRAGTTQVFRPFEAQRMLELPMHIMDTALFFPSYMHLSFKQADAIVKDLADNATRFGGTLTINWHDRSIAPERRWNDLYIDLLDYLESKGAWFATAREAVSWFQKRRSSAFENVSFEDNNIQVRVSLSQESNLPDLNLRVHTVSTRPFSGFENEKSQERFVDFSFNQSVEMSVPIQRST